MWRNRRTSTVPAYFRCWINTKCHTRLRRQRIRVNVLDIEPRTKAEGLAERLIDEPRKAHDAGSRLFLFGAFKGVRCLL
jgi:hypothetical protein